MWKQLLAPKCLNSCINHQKSEDWLKNHDIKIDMYTHFGWSLLVFIYLLEVVGSCF